jgi:NADP-dependent 3-hydroxy acid dehydrogenase YdfG
MTRTALITGASSGIGRATANAFVALDYRLILCGRRADRLAEVQSELSQSTSVITLTFDVRDSAAVAGAIASLPADWQQDGHPLVDILVNNAGNAHGMSPIQEGDTADWDQMIDGNVQGLLYVSKAVIPGMVARQRGPYRES